MKVSKEAVEAAYLALTKCDDAVIESRLKVAIQAAFDETFKPGELTIEPMMGEFVPQRDYRKELWISHAAILTQDNVLSEQETAASCNKLVLEFDKFFAQKEGAQ